MFTRPLSRRAQSLGVSVAFRSLLFAAGACSKDATTPPAPSTFSITSGASQTATVNTALAAPVVVTVVDAGGKPIAGIGVSFVPASGSGTVSAAEVSTDANGNAQISWTLGTVAGADSMEVTAGSLAPTTIVATATPDAPSSITIVAGNDQSAVAGTSLSAPLEVKVVDQFGNAVPSATVNWTDESGGVLTQVTTTTDKNGIAQDALQVVGKPGTDEVVATIVAGSAPVTATFVEDAM